MQVLLFLKQAHHYLHDTQGSFLSKDKRVTLKVWDPVLSFWQIIADYRMCHHPVLPDGTQKLQ